MIKDEIRNKLRETDNTLHQIDFNDNNILCSKYYPKDYMNEEYYSRPIRRIYANCIDINGYKILYRKYSNIEDSYYQFYVEYYIPTKNETIHRHAFSTINEAIDAYNSINL